MSEEKTISIEEHEKVIKLLHEEILRRDEIIDKLRADNKILIKTSLKRVNDMKDLEEKTKRKLSLYK